MDIDIKVITTQQKELKQYADNIAELRRKLVNYQNNLNIAWQSREIDALNQSLDSALRRLTRMSMDLEDIGQDLLGSFQQLEESETHETED